jgi:putative NIF3 family GTP cyclohydrolase 1 type 2
MEDGCMTHFTIQDTIDRILAVAAVDPLPQTSDTIKTGDPTQPLTGIVTTFLATGAVIARAADLGANLIITHEPTFYTHEDATDWLHDDPVYQAKRQLIDAHNIVIWRFHDYWHLTRPDGIMVGLAQRLGA